MRYDPTTPTPTAPAPAPKAKRVPKPVLTPAMKAFAGVSNAMVQIMAPCSPPNVDQVRADFMTYLAETNATEWRSAWQTWRSANVVQVPSSTLQVAPTEPETCNLPPEPSPIVPRSEFPVPSSPHPWLARLHRRRQLGLSIREPGTLAIA